MIKSIIPNKEEIKSEDLLTKGKIAHYLDSLNTVTGKRPWPIPVVKEIRPEWRDTLSSRDDETFFDLIDQLNEGKSADEIKSHIYVCG